MPELKHNLDNFILFLAQIIIVYGVVIVALVNLSRNNQNRELWISLLSSSVGYLLPSPIIKKHDLPRPAV